jgi:hypothetical protein
VNSDSSVASSDELSASRREPVVAAAHTLALPSSGTVIASFTSVVQ